MLKLLDWMSLRESHKGSSKLFGHSRTILRLRQTQVRQEFHPCFKTRDVVAMADSTNKTGLHHLPELDYRSEWRSRPRDRIVVIVGVLNADALTLSSFENSDEGIRAFRPFRAGYAIVNRCQKLPDEKPLPFLPRSLRSWHILPSQLRRNAGVPVGPQSDRLQPRFLAIVEPRTRREPSSRLRPS